ncbi:MAG: hypothetical protein JNK48_05795 [Bryobacterales bacterium]|nr:hypothetical protein [Bryobacterales bacterium]
MALQSKLFTEESPGKAVLKRCSETHAGHLLRGMSTNAAVKDAVARVQTALRKAGLTVSDPAGVYGASTEAAVLKFKGPPRNILGPGQTKPDAIVGIQTIHQLDAVMGGGGTPAPAPAELEFGSMAWGFSFFGNKGFTKKGDYTLFIRSNEVQDSRTFGINEMTSEGNLLSGFKGGTSGAFLTPRKVLANDFLGASANVFVQKSGKLLHGFIQLNVSSKQFLVNLPLTPFQEEGLLGSVSSGTLLVKGFVVKG